MSMKATKRIASQADATAEQQLAGFIKKFDSKNAALIRSVRKVLRERLPTANELVYDNYNFFVIGYCSTERPSDCILSIAAGANGVGLSFYYGATLPDPHKLLLGSGSQNRFIRIESAATLASPEVEELIAAAIAQAERPLPVSGRGPGTTRQLFDPCGPVGGITFPMNCRRKIIPFPSDISRFSRDTMYTQASLIGDSARPSETRYFQRAD
jgi:hypothetical protein